MSIFTPKGHYDNQEIRKRLRKVQLPKGKKLSEDGIDDIIQQFWLRDLYNSFISDPIYYRYLEEFLKKKGLEEFSRLSFYRYLFDRLLPSSKLKALKPFSLIFELLHRNDLEITEVRKILKDKQFSSLRLVDLIKAYLVKIEKGKIIWIHHTLTEYLTSELILTSDKPIDEFKRYAFIKLSKDDIALKPSWYGVLRFLMGSKESNLIFKWLIYEIQKNNNILDDTLAEIIVSIDSTKLSPSIKSSIFETIYGIYRERKLWLSYLTRSSLYKFFDPRFKDLLKNDLRETKDETETYVRRGNAVSVFEGVAKNYPKLFSEKETQFWKEELIKFAKDKNVNGVLQRHSLSALAIFKEPDIIPKVASSLDSSDNLIKEAFIKLSLETDPNNPIIIDQIALGLNKGVSIYGRHALYEITSPEAIKYLIENHFLKDKELLKRFLDKESIFNRDEEKGDDQLLKNLLKALEIDPKFLELYKKLLIEASNLAAKHYYDKSYFLSQLAKIILTKDEDLIFELLDIIKSKATENEKWHLLYSYKQLFADIVEPDNLEKFSSIVKGIYPKNDVVLQYVVGYSNRTRGAIGKKIWLIAKNKKLLSEQFFNPGPEFDYEAKRNKEIYEEFKKHLEPAPKEFMTDVFSRYAENSKIINRLAKKEEINRLKYLALDEGIKKIDPSKFIVRINRDKEGGGKKFTWSSQAQYFGDIIRVLKILKPTVLSNADIRSKIINFIPYAFSDDLGLILEVVPKIEDKDLEWVNEKLLDRDKDHRYLIPDSYIYLVSQYIKKGFSLPTSVKVLRSFSEDSKIEESVRIFALKTLGGLLSKTEANYKYFKNLFDQSKDKEASYEIKVMELANSILISLFKDEVAINWRFEQIKNKQGSFDSKSKFSFHSVGPFEDELDSLSFAKPLIELGDEKYLKKFLGLLQFSIENTIEKGKEYWEYTNYIWRIVFAYLERLKVHNSFEPLLEVEAWVSKYNVKGEGNWLKARLFQTRLDYINDLGRINAVERAFSLVREVDSP